jgi:hypothetical protein
MRMIVVLPAPVIAEQADDFVAPDLETDIGYGQHGAEVFGKVVDFNHEVHPVGSAGAPAGGRGGPRDRAPGNFVL